MRIYRTDPDGDVRVDPKWDVAKGLGSVSGIDAVAAPTGVTVAATDERKVYRAQLALACPDDS